MGQTRNTDSDELELFDELIGKRAYFTRLQDATREDWRLILSNYSPWARALPNRVIAHLRLLEGETARNPVARLEHWLQTATLALRDGRDEEYVVCALIHDIGDTLASFNHAEFAATILKPFVSEKNYWIVLNHGVYTGYYWFQYLGTDRNNRDHFRTHPRSRHLHHFSLNYDYPAFNPHSQSTT